MSKVRDRFETALKLSAKTEGITLPDVREELRPKTASEVRELEWTRQQARSRIGELCAEEAIVVAFCRLLRKPTYGEPTSLDWEILRLCDDGAIVGLVWREENAARLRELRDLMPSVRS